VKHINFLQTVLTAEITALAEFQHLRFSIVLKSDSHSYSLGKQFEEFVRKVRAVGQTELAVYEFQGSAQQIELISLTRQISASQVDTEPLIFT